MRTMKRIGRWFDCQITERPFFSALIVLVVVMVPGYARLESTAKSASSAAVTSAQTAQELVKTTKAQQQTNCQTRNSAQKNGRDRFSSFFKGIEVVLVNTPGASEERKQQTREFVSKLRNAVPLDASLEDVDCNNDGALTSEDYAPPYSLDHNPHKKGN
jgi:hypothetical protein